MQSDNDAAVLYVDDDVVNLRVFEANFGKQLKVLTCESAAQALELLRSGQHEIAVVLADERMPSMTGSELLEHVAKLCPHAHLMVVTAYADMDAVMRAVNRVKVTRYYYKPWVREELQQALDDALHIYRLQKQLREQPSSDHVAPYDADRASELASAEARLLEQDLGALGDRLATLEPVRNDREIGRLLGRCREAARRLCVALGPNPGAARPLLDPRS
jgi:two-component system NtrC family sensor kinase